VSNTIQYDPLLVSSLADELRKRLRGRGCASVPVFAADLSVTLLLDRREQLRADLHPTRGWIRVLPAPPGEPGELDAICEGIESLPDERIFRIDLHETGRFRSAGRSLVLELHTNQWNAILLDEEGRIVSVLRTRLAGGRALRTGERYVAPGGVPRIACMEGEEARIRAEWEREIGGADPERRRTRLVSRFAGTGTLNADWILGGEGARWDPDASFQRWWWLCSGPEVRPALLRLGDRLIPYPVALSGIPAEPHPSLLDAMAAIADREAPARVDPGLERARALVAERLTSAERRLEKLRKEVEAAEGASRIRGWGDLILARIHQIPRGAESVRLEGWEGDPVEVPLDPRLTPAENAALHYDRAGRMSRAAARLPTLIREAETEIERWRAAAEPIARGELPTGIEPLLRRREESTQRSPSAGGGLPYRVFRTSGGIEVRVGRTARDNDRLTFRESSPNDVWLHARSVPGSHVILRWGDPEAAPPARDLREAAQLAAVFSRARTSGTVAVDWTRRKHVRKPRGGAPGLVIPQRSKTLFVEPDPAIVDRLAEDS